MVHSHLATSSKSLKLNYHPNFTKMDYKVILNNIKESSFKKPGIYFFIIFFLAYLSLNIWINKFYVILPTFLDYRFAIIMFSVASTLIVSSLIAINLNLIIAKFKIVKSLSDVKSGSLTFLGGFSGLLGGVCPGCFSGLFPAVAVAITGTAITLSALPLLGQEFQIASAAILIFSIIYIGKQPNICKIK